MFPVSILLDAIFLQTLHFAGKKVWLVVSENPNNDEQIARQAEHYCTKTVANIAKTPPLRPFSCIFLGWLMKKKYLCGVSYEHIIKRI